MGSYSAINGLGYGRTDCQDCHWCLNADWPMEPSLPIDTARIFNHYGRLPAYGIVGNGIAIYAASM